MNNLKYKLTIALMAIVFTIQAQKQSFQLQDENQHPLIGVTFTYADQSGISDNSGLIEFTYSEGSIMYLSYLGFGRWEMDNVLLESTVKKGHYIRESIQKELQPVTIISMRLKTTEEENMEFDYQDRMAHDGGELLSATPTISGIRKGGNYGLDPVMRGFKYDQLNVVMNGTQCATAACPNRMDPPTSQMAPNMLEKVEIFKGPYAMRFGGGLGGTINFVTSEPFFTEHAKVYGRLSGRYDSNGEVLKSESMVGIAGAKYNIGLFGSWAEGNDYTDGEDRTIPADFQRSSFGIKSAFNPSEHQTFEISAFQNKAKDVDFPALMMDLRSDKTLMLNASHKISFEERSLDSWTTTLFLSSVDHLMDNKLKNLDPRMMNASTDAKTKNYGGRTELLWKKGGTKLYLGADFKLEDAEGLREREFLMGPMSGNTLIDNAWQHGQIQKAGIFGEYNFRINAWQMVLASRVELNKAKVLDADPSFLEEYPDASTTQINPSFSIGGLNELTEGVTIGIWAARAQRSAGLAERYINKFSIGQDPYEMLGNPDLKPEVNNQVDLTFEWKTAKSNFSVDIFGGLMQNFISSIIDPSIATILPNRPGVRRFVNIDKAYKTGFEIGYNQHLTSWLCHDINVAYTYAQDAEREQPLPEIAPLDMRYSICGKLINDRLKPVLKVRYVADQNRISSEFGETATPGFTLLDFNIAYIMHNNLKIQVGANNLLDKTYYEHLSRSTAGMNPLPLNAQGRNFYLAFGYTLSK